MYNQAKLSKIICVISVFIFALSIHANANSINSTNSIMAIMTSSMTKFGTVPRLSRSARSASSSSSVRSARRCWASAGSAGSAGLEGSAGKRAEMNFVPTRRNQTNSNIYSYHASSAMAARCIGSHHGTSPPPLAFAAFAALTPSGSLLSNNCNHKWMSRLRFIQHGCIFHSRCQSFHSSTMLLMGKRKKNGGKSKKAKLLQNSSGAGGGGGGDGAGGAAVSQKVKGSLEGDLDFMEEFDEFDSVDGGGTESESFLRRLDGSMETASEASEASEASQSSLSEGLDVVQADQTDEADEANKAHATEESDNSETGEAKTTPFATEYHAPVMPTECIEALLLQGEWGDMLQEKKNRWRKKRSILEAKRKRMLSYYGEDEDDDDEDGEDDDDDEDEGEEEEEEEEVVNEEERDSTKRDNHLSGSLEEPAQPRLFIDGTLGGGGHSEALLQQLNPGDVLIGCDVDPEALSTASKRLSQYLVTHEYILDFDFGDDEVKCEWEEGRPIFLPVQSNFRNLLDVLAKVRHPITGKILLGDRRNLPEGHTPLNDVEFPHGVNGMLLDLGVSSHQIDTSERGFAFMKDGPLDMRMTGNSQILSTSTTLGSSLTAADICNEFDESSLISILRNYGDEPRAKRIVSAIVSSRPLFTTTDLVHAINSVTPTFARQKRAGLIATCARVFQALRIVVNEEDGALKEVLENVAPCVLRRDGDHFVLPDESDGNCNGRTGGVLAVLSYHSMEDKMTKRVIRDGSVNLIDGVQKSVGGGFFDRDLFGNPIGGSDEFGSKHSTKPFEPLAKPRKATDEEVAGNSRARSATFRVAIRV